MSCNVLLALAWPDHVFHSLAQRWFAAHCCVAANRKWRTLQEAASLRSRFCIAARRPENLRELRGAAIHSKAGFGRGAAVAGHKSKDGVVATLDRGMLSLAGKNL